MRKIIPILAALLLACLQGSAAPPRTTATQKLITAYAAREPLRSGSVSILAVRMNGDTLAQYNRRQKLVPASNVKLITTGLALSHLGPSWRFRTSLAYSGEIRDSVLLGDVYILGGGDPTTGSASECSGVPETVFGAWKALLEMTVA